MMKYARLSTLIKQRHVSLCGHVSHTTPSTLKAKTTYTSVYVSIRPYIRPRHYDRQSSSLSDAMKRQNNVFHQIGRAVNNLDPNKVLWSVIGINVGVFGLWQYGISSYKQFGDPEWLNFMLKHFMNSPDAWQNGRWHTLLTSAFSHKDLDHLGINLLVLYSIGQGVMEAVGASRFLLLYCGAGIAGSIATLVYRKYLRPALVGGNDGSRSAMRSPPSMGSLGASGSVMGLTTFFACAFPKATFLVFFVIPMPAIAVVGLFATYDIYKATTLNTGIVDSAAHIGGVSYGAAYWFLRVKPLLRAGRWRV